MARWASMRLSALSALALCAQACSCSEVTVEPQASGTAASASSSAATGATGPSSSSAGGTGGAGGMPGGAGGQGGEPSECPCVGYDEIDGVCTWAGGPDDAELSDVAAWTTTGSVVVDPNAAGSTSPGVARIDQTALCTYGDSVSQTFEMPSYRCAEPLALVFDTRAGTPTWPVAAEADLAIGLAGGWLSHFEYAMSPWTEWKTVKKCLGERAYRDGPIDLVFEGLDPWGCDPINEVSVELDEVRIVPAPECPAPQTTINGDFEAGDTGWTAAAPSGVIAGAGSMGSVGGSLVRQSPCDSAALHGTTSTPVSETLATPALAIWTAGSSSKETMVTFDARVLGSLPKQPGPETRICIPRWAQGVTASVGFMLPHIGGLCAVPLDDEILVDDLAFVSEPACDLSTGIADGGFENAVAAPSVRSWMSDADDGAQVELHVDGPGDVQAHGGAVAARLSNTRYCSSAELSTTITVPEPSGSNGPAVRYWYRATATISGVYGWLAGDLTGFGLPSTDVWTQHVICIDPKRSGRPARLTLGIGSSQGACQSTFPEEVAWFDDVEATTDPSCPP